uniref:Uncharacterized protein n=1 Tax=Rhizophora mucronata TaxID=61149 RepID=A0A2P2JVZ4_RHIMU
MDFTFCNSNL